MINPDDETDTTEEEFDAMWAEGMIQTRIVLSAEDFDEFVRKLDEPLSPEASEKLRRLFEAFRYDKWHDEDCTEPDCFGDCHLWKASPEESP